MENKWILKQDDSCHWYLVPAEDAQHFNSWLDSFANHDEDYRGIDFEEYRLQMHPSNYVFTGTFEERKD